MFKAAIFHRILLTCIVGLLTGATAVAQAPAVSSGATPTDCLITGYIREIGPLGLRADTLLKGISGQPYSLAADIGRLAGVPELRGVDLTAPVRFYYMNPKAFARPWVIQLHANDPDTLRAAVESLGPEASPVRIDGDIATLGEPAAVERVLAWQLARMPEAVKPESPHQFLLRLDVQALVRAFEPELAQQLEAMKGRMREALDRPAGGPADEAEIAAMQSHLDTALAALREVRDVTLLANLSDGTLSLRVEARPVPGGMMDRLVRHHDRGGMDVLSRLPADVTVALSHNLSMAEAARGMVARYLGMVSGRAPAVPVPAGFHAMALIMPASGIPVEFIALREGGASAMESQWAQWTQAQEGPFALKPIERNALPRLAEISLREGAPAHMAARIVSLLLGPAPRAALWTDKGDGLLAVGADPIARVERLRTQAPTESLMQRRAFRVSAAEGPRRPNLLLYVSADGLRRYLALSGLRLSAPAPDEPGLFAALELRADGAVSAGMRLSLLPLAVEGEK